MVGNRANYEKEDVIRTFLLVNNSSRHELMDKLELGEGTVRSILDELKDKGLIESSQQGHVKTDKGKKLLDEWNFEIKEVETNFYEGTQVCICFNSDELNILELRDEAIRKGAKAALILKKENDTISGKGCDEINLEQAKELFNDYNSLIITFGENKKDVYNSAIGVLGKIIHLM